MAVKETPASEPRHGLGEVERREIGRALPRSWVQFELSPGRAEASWKPIGLEDPWARTGVSFLS